MQRYFCMQRLILFVLLSISTLTLLQAQLHVEGITVVDAYKSKRGCYVFAPADVAERDSLKLVVFLHGYGAINPMIYGAWLRDLVGQEAVVIFPRYQKAILRPSTKKFATLAAAGIHRGLKMIEERGWPVQTDGITYIGHSYGGTLSAYMLAREDLLGLPRGAAALLAAPGTSRFHGSRLESYADIAPDVEVIAITHAGDWVTKTEFVELLAQTVQPTADFTWYHQSATAFDRDTLSEHHNECYGVDRHFDSGYRNYSTRKALRVGTIDALDTLLYWPLARRLLHSQPPLVQESAENFTAIDARGQKVILARRKVLTPAHPDPTAALPAHRDRQ